MKTGQLFLFVLAYGWGRIWHYQKWIKHLLILAIIGIGAWGADFAGRESFKSEAITQVTKNEKTIIEGKTVTQQAAPGQPELAQTEKTRSGADKTEPKDTEAKKNAKTTTEADKTEPGKTDKTHTEVKKTGTTKPQTALTDKTKFFDFWKILALYSLVLFFWWGLQSRKRLVVEAFTYYSGDKDVKDDPRGLGTLLAIELDRLQRLYRAVDEQRAVSTATGVGRFMEISFKGEDTSSILDKAVSPDSKLSLGPLHIPVGSIMALLGRLFQGPRLIGSLHVENTAENIDKFTLAAKLVGGGRPSGWLVTKELPQSSANQQSKTPKQINMAGGTVEKLEADRYGLLVRELAYRVFTELTLASITVRWEATRAFSEGLQAYRDCLRTPKDRTLNLKKAEHFLMEAISIDEKMDLAYYNLGVVYGELDRNDAAAAAFTKSIELNKARWEATYGMGLLHYTKMMDKQDYGNTFGEVLNYGERLTELQPDNPKAPNLLGLAFYARARKTKSEAPETAAEDFQRAVYYFTEAVRLAWKSLRREVRRGEFISASGGSTIRPRQEILLMCSHNLAITLWASVAGKDDGDKLIKLQEAERILRQSLYLQKFKGLRDDSAISDLHAALGRICLESRQYPQALEQFKKAARIDPGEIRYWGFLALAGAQEIRATEPALKKIREEVKTACYKSLDCLDVNDAATPSKLARLIKLLEDEHLQQDPDLRSLIDIAGFLAELDKIADNVESLKSKYGDLAKDENRNWECAQVAIKLGKLAAPDGKPEDAVTYFQAALDKLESTYLHEIQRQGLWAHLAQCRRSINKPLENLMALKEIKHGLMADPLSPSLHKELGFIYFDLCRFAEAQAALQNALFWDPNNPEIYYYLGLANFHLVPHTHAGQGTQRTRGLEQAGRYLHDALNLYANAKLNDPEGVENIRKLGQTHYWLGKVYLEMNEPGLAITSLMIAGNLQDAWEQTSADQAPPEPAAPLTDESEQASLEQLACRPIPLDPIIPPTETPDKKIPPDTRLLLGVAFLKNKNINEAENLFQALIDTYVSQPENLELLVKARLYYALSLAERRGDFNLALQLLDETKLALPRLDRKSKELEAFCRDCEGWLYFRQDAIDDAIKNLEQAVSLWAAPGSYYRLARAFEYKADLTEGQEQRTCLQRAREYYKLAQDLDFRQEYKSELEDLKKRLASRSPSGEAAASPDEQSGKDGTAGNGEQGQVPAEPSPKSTA